MVGTTPEAICQVNGEVLVLSCVGIAAWHVVCHRALVVPRFEPPVHFEHLEMETEHRGTPPYTDAFMHAIWLREAFCTTTNIDIPCV